MTPGFGPYKGGESGYINYRIFKESLKERKIPAAKSGCLSSIAGVIIIFAVFAALLIH